VFPLHIGHRVTCSTELVAFPLLDQQLDLIFIFCIISISEFYTYSKKLYCLIL